MERRLYWGRSFPLQLRAVVGEGASGSRGVPEMCHDEARWSARAGEAGLRNYDYQFFVSDCSAEANYGGLLLLPIGLFKCIVVLFCTAERRICRRLSAGVDSDCGVFEWCVDLFRRYHSYGRVKVVARRVVVLMCVVVLS